MRTITEIIKAAGGTTAIHEASVRLSQESGDRSLTKDAIYKWPTIGIQDRHWPLLMSLTDTTPEELFEANRKARSAESAA